MKGLTKRLFALVICTAVFAGCGNPWMKAITAPLYNDKDAPEEPAQTGSAKAITAFTITSPASAGVINEAAKTIAVAVPYGTDVTGLTTDITHTGVNINPASGTVQNFTTSVSYTVTAEDGTSQAYTVTVTAASALNNVTEVTAYLDAASGGTSAADPIPLALDIDLAADWSTLLQAIANTNGGAGAYVDLDLSDSTMSGGTEFNPDYTISTGKNMIVSLTLPDTATSIAAGSPGNHTFRSFNNLQEVNGGQVTDIGDYAFYYCASLTSVILPEATTIGDNVFYNCTNLTSVTLPKATDIGAYAFFYCASLESVTLPEATTIGARTFLNCTGLETVSLPAATSIGNSAFSSCTALTNLYFQTTSPPTLSGSGNNAPFYSTGPSGTLTIHVPSGMVSAYESGWGVSASTSYNGNLSVYGNNHKAIEIVD